MFYFCKCVICHENKQYTNTNTNMEVKKNKFTCMHHILQKKLLDKACTVVGTFVLQNEGSKPINLFISVLNSPRTGND